MQEGINSSVTCIFLGINVDRNFLFDSNKSKLFL